MLNLQPLTSEEVQGILELYPDLTPSILSEKGGNYRRAVGGIFHLTKRNYSIAEIEQLADDCNVPFEHFGFVAYKSYGMESPKNPHNDIESIKREAMFTVNMNVTIGFFLKGLQGPPGAEGSSAPPPPEDGSGDSGQAGPQGPPGSY